MQQASNTALATALAPGQVRQFVVRLEFDWDLNGGFANVNSDLSAVFESATIDRQLSGTVPDDLEVTEGYVAGQLDLKLSGILADGTPTWKAFSPYSGHPLGTAALKTIPMFLDLGVLTPLGPIYLRQFTGYLSDSMPSRADGNVTITCYDAATVLASPVTLPTWAVDLFTRTQLTANPDTPDSGTIALSWVLENLLRQNGFYQGPPWHPNAVVAWTMNGAALPEVGSIAAEDRWVIDDFWSSGYGQWNIPQFSPSGQVSDIYGPGQFGQTCFKGSTHLPVLSPVRTLTYLYGNAHADTPSGQVLPVNTYGSANSNLLGVAAWMLVDSSQTTTPSTLQFILEELHLNFSSSDFRPGYVLVNFNHGTGIITAQATNEGQATDWAWTMTGTMSAGWHYVEMVFQFTSTALNGQLFIDGVSNAPATNGGHAGPIGSFTYSNDTTNTNLGQVIARGPLQYVQVYYQNNTALTARTPPVRTPTNPTVAIDRATTRLLWLPDVVAASGWDTLKAASTAELGALYVTEAGVVTWDSHATVLSRQVAGASVMTLTLDQLSDVQPKADVASIVNTMPYATHAQHSEYHSSVYVTSKPDQFQVPAHTTQQFNVTNTAVQSIRLGAVSFHPQAQGYSNPSNPSEPGGAGPSGLFTFRDWMNIYGPDFWYDGFTAYSPGASDPSAQPAEGTGLNAQPLLGFATGDQDSRHMRLLLVNSNTSGGVLEYAVNDSAPFLKVGGTLMVDDGSVSGQYQDATSVATYGTRSLPYPSSDWVQDPPSVLTVVTSVVNYTRNPHPYFQSTEIVGDPRLQLQDVVTLSDPLGMGGSMPASVYGIHRSISLTDGVADQLTLRTF